MSEAVAPTREGGEMSWYLDDRGFEVPEGYLEGVEEARRLLWDHLAQLMQDAEQDAATVAADFAAWEAQMQGVAS